MSRITTSIIALFSMASLWGQWSVPTQVELVGTSPEQRQVTGLAHPTAEDHGVPMDADRYNTTAWAQATGDNDLTAALTPPLSAYRPGLRITLLPAGSNSAGVTVNVDGLGAVPVQKGPGLALDSADLQAGVPVQLVYDGTTFQVTNQLHPSCPAGFMPIGRDVCVEMTTHAASTWYGGVNQCTARGYRLCGFAEWIQACQMPNGIFPTVSDYEWVDEAANHNNYAKLMGMTETGTPNCLAGGLRVPNGLAPFRCCSSR